MKLAFSTDFRRILIPSFINIRWVGAELFHVDGETYGRTDMTKLIVAFHNFANVPKNHVDSQDFEWVLSVD